MNSAIALKYCANCGAKIIPEARFCAQCGRNLLSPAASSALSFKALLLTLLFAVPLWGAMTLFSTSLTGTAPEQVLQAKKSPGMAEDSELSALRAVLKEQPESISANLALAQALYARLDETPSSMQVAFEIIDILAKVLKLDSNNKEAILLMADVSFAQQAFSKASELYQRYLTLSPKDPDVRAKFASSLTFVGQFDEAVEELNAVLKEHPKNFHANAYLAIAYAQVGKVEQAKKIGKTTLELAPTDEAKRRFQRFLDTLEKPQEGDQPQPSEPDAKEAKNAEQAIFQSVKSNPVAGPKLSSSKQPSADKIVLYFENFPMEAMPPFAKDKFLGRIREAAEPFKEIKEIVLVDQASGKDLDRVVLKR